MKYLLSILVIMVATSASTEDQSILVNRANFRCRVERYLNAVDDGRSTQTIYWAFAEYQSSGPQFESFLAGGEDYQEVVSHCLMVEEILVEAEASLGHLTVLADTKTATRRIQGMEGGVYVPRPACYYDIYTMTLNTLIFPHNLELEHLEYSRQRYYDECPSGLDIDK